MNFELKLSLAQYLTSFSEKSEKSDLRLLNLFDDQLHTISLLSFFHGYIWHTVQNIQLSVLWGLKQLISTYISSRNKE
jgi:hypothetical protein